MRGLAVERIPHRELRNRSSEILRAVAAGESFEITNHGKVVAVLSPPGSQRRLLVRAATKQGGWGDLPCFTTDETVQQILDDLRGDR